MENTYNFRKSTDTFLRATKVIPTGIYGHQTPALLVPGSFPYYTAKASGCRYQDIDGNELIDYICSYGPMVLGYNNPEVEAAAQAQRELFDCASHPGEVMVRLAERLVELIPAADWAAFAKNGSDVTSWALQVAREHTKRRKVLMVQDTYHGAHPWSTPGHGGLIHEDRAHLHYFTWNDTDSFFKLIEKYKGDIAAVIMTPFHHPTYYASQMPAPGWWATIEKTCREQGIILVLDDVRASFRLHIGGSNEYFGFKPDLICFCKALANGHPLSACCGTNELKLAAARVYFSGTYWYSAVPMAASLATLDILERTDAVAHMFKIGGMLMDGLEDLAESHGLQFKRSGPPSMPFPHFTNEDNFMRQQVFCSEVTKRGSLFHPHHNWFMSAAHSEKDIEETLKHADAAFKIVKNEFGS